MPETVTFLGLVVAPAPVGVKLNEYVPLGKLVEINGILPVPPQVVGFITVPAEIVGVAGSAIIFEVATVPVQPLLVTEKLL